MSTLEEYRQPWESDNHWKLRENFIKAFRDTFPEDRLLCLAQVYSNIELLGCSYPKDVMVQIRELAKNLDAPEGCKNKKPISFVKADQNSVNQQQNKREQHNSSPNNSKRPKLMPSEEVDNDSISSDHISQTPISDEEKQGFVKFANQVRVYLQKKLTPLESIINTAKKLKMTLNFEIKLMPVSLPNEPIYECDLSIEDRFICSKQSNSKKKSRTQAAICATDILMNPSSFLFTTKEDTPPSPPNVSEVNEDVSVNVEQIEGEQPKEQTTEMLDTDECQNENNTLFPGVLNEYKGDKIPAISEANDDTTTLENSVPPEKKFNLSPELCSELRNVFIIMDYVDQVPQRALSVLLTSASFCHVTFTFSFQMLPSERKNVFLIRADVSYNDEIIGTGTNTNKFEAKHIAAENALTVLKEIVYTVQVKTANHEGYVITRDELLGVSEAPSAIIADNNIGCQMLKSMGWTGGTIGKIGSEGILEPIQADTRFKIGQGLGYSGIQCDEKKFAAAVRRMIEDYARANTTRDLIFSNEFTIEERKVVHSIAKRYNLKNSSHGSGEARHVIVSRRFSAMQLIRFLLDSGGSTYKYKLLTPSSMHYI